MYIAILGRQAKLSMAELERLHGSQAVSWFGDSTALIDSESFDFERLGGSRKAGRVIYDEPSHSWHTVSRAIVDYYFEQWRAIDHKITLGISTYGWNISPREIQKTGIILKKKLRDENISLRLIPNEQAELSTATSHHNKLGLSPNKVELLVVHHSGRVIIAESIGSQNITALAARDQARPKTDAFVGMLPPKLALMMVNLAVGTQNSSANQSSPSEQPSHPEGSAFPAERGQEISNLRPRAPEGGDGSEEARGSSINEDTQGNNSSPRLLLDPFCGTGVVLQEALLLGYDVYGSDLSEKMVDYSTANLDWLSQKWNLGGSYNIEHGDAMTHQWLPPIDAIASEAYLGQPFSAPPSSAKLREVRGNCDHIIGSFLENVGRQIAPGTPICLAVPAWNDGRDHFAHIPLVDQLEKYGFTRIDLKNVHHRDLLYYRPGQVVARDLLLMQKT